MLSLIIPSIVALLTVLLIMPPFIRRMHDQGFLGKDMNKYTKQKVAELGGVVVFLGFSFGVFAAIFIATYLKLFTIDLSLLLAGFCTIAMICFIGLIDPTRPPKGKKQIYDPEYFSVKRTEEWYREQFADWTGSDLHWYVRTDALYTNDWFKKGKNF